MPLSNLAVREMIKTFRRTPGVVAAHILDGSTGACLTSWEGTEGSEAMGSGLASLFAMHHQTGADGRRESDLSISDGSRTMLARSAFGGRYIVCFLLDPEILSEGKGWSLLQSVIDAAHAKAAP